MFHPNDACCFFSIVCTQVAQKTVSTMLNGKAVPEGELYLARKAGFGNLADIVDRLNVCFRPVSKNGEGKGMPLSLHRTQVSRNINTTGDLIFKEKRKIIQESLHCSPFLDESTTVGMGTRPVYAGAIATTKDFLWACFFCGAARHLWVRWRTDMLQHGEGNLCECWVVGEIPRYWH